MTVIDHAPHSWFLLANGDALFLDASCNHGAFGYSWLIELSPEERLHYHAEGHAFAGRLAEDIHNSAPILEASRSPYKDRHCSGERRAEVVEAVRSWRASMAG